MVEIRFSSQFKKSLQKIKNASLKGNIEKHMKKIADNPEIGKPLRYDLRGERTVHIKPFRILYDYKDDVITFLLFEHRDDVYE